MYTIHGIIINLCSYKPLMGTGSEKLFNMQTGNYGADSVNWVDPRFKAGRVISLADLWMQQRTFTKPEGIVFGKCVYKKRHAAVQQRGRVRGAAKYLSG